MKIVSTDCRQFHIRADFIIVFIESLLLRRLDLVERILIVLRGQVDSLFRHVSDSMVGLDHVRVGAGVLRELH